MKEKNMWKELLNRAGWILVFLLAVLLYQVPLVVTSILTLKEVALLQSGLIVAGLSIVVLALFIMGARKTKLASFGLSFFKAKDLARLALSYLVILAFNILGVVLLRLMNETTTSNQSNINDLVQNSSLISSFFLLVLIAPICEEILCRGVIPKKLFRGKENVGYIVGAIIFALLHLPTNLPSLLILWRNVNCANLDSL
ncbi:caax amino protease family protein [Streptococcus pneumoniae]|nr:caax amino protease family protein [Streptococcus pneumoniae]VKY26421.1 caax amino protease family protein [Streptococcus pneumoniae]VLD41875.1 caax amino protease family protein [Streptococcus pneumoniae]